MVELAAVVNHRGLPCRVFLLSGGPVGELRGRLIDGHRAERRADATPAGSHVGRHRPVHLLEAAFPWTARIPVARRYGLGEFDRERLAPFIEDCELIGRRTLSQRSSPAWLETAECL